MHHLVGGAAVHTGADEPGEGGVFQFPLPGEVRVHRPDGPGVTLQAAQGHGGGVQAGVGTGTELLILPAEVLQPSVQDLPDTLVEGGLVSAPDQRLEVVGQVVGIGGVLRFCVLCRHRIRRQGGLLRHVLLRRILRRKPGIVHIIGHIVRPFSAGVDGLLFRVISRTVRERPPGGDFFHQRKKSPKTPLETHGFKTSFARGELSDIVCACRAITGATTFWLQI